MLIASSTDTHLDLLVRAVEAGKAVLCEKPIDLDLAKVDASWARIKDRRPTIMVGFNRRFDPSFKALRERIQAGEIGKLEQVVITSRDPGPPPIAYIEVSGGLFRDMTIHDFDMARYLMGDIEAVHAIGAIWSTRRSRQAGDIDAAMITLVAKSGALCQISNSRRCAYGYDQRIEAFGEQGMLQAGNQRPTTVSFWGAPRTEAATRSFTSSSSATRPAYLAEIDHFVDCVEQGTAPLVGYRDGREALRLADAALGSMRDRAGRSGSTDGGDGKTAMADLLLKNHAPDAQGLVHRVTPESAGWGHVGFELYRLQAGQSLEAATGEREACLVLVGGKARSPRGGRDFGEIGERMGPFEGKKPVAVYVPWQSGYRVEATTDLELAVCSAPGGGDHAARLIGPDQVAYSVRGKGSNTRHVYDILPETEPAHSLLVVEVITPAGCWSSYPSHKHDTDNLPHESELQETYYHRLNPPQGFALQRVYTDDRSLDAEHGRGGRRRRARAQGAITPAAPRTATTSTI